jgi:threonine/homoserine/homoserine lactone efflux protein
MHNKNQSPEEIKQRKRTDFLITSVIFCVFIVAAAVAIFFVRTNPVGVIVGIVCLAWLIYSFVKQIKKYKSETDEEKK